MSFNVNLQVRQSLNWAKMVFDNDKVAGRFGLATKAEFNE